MTEDLENRPEIAGDDLDQITPENRHVIGARVAGKYEPFRIGEHEVIIKVSSVSLDEEFDETPIPDEDTDTDSE